MKDEHKSKEVLIKELKTLQKSVQSHEAKNKRYRKMYSELREKSRKLRDDKARKKEGEGDFREPEDFETLLRESDERYRLLFNSITDAVYVHHVSPEKPGKFVAVNESACRMLGYTEDELLQMEVKDIDEPKQEERIPAIHEMLYSDGCALFETHHITKDGKRIPVEINIRLFEFRGKQAVLSVVRDITERKRAEELLKEQTHFLKTLIDGIPDIVGLQRPDHTVLFYNQTGYKFLHKPPAEVDGKKCYQLIGRDIPCEICAISQAAISKKIETIEMFLPDPQLWLEARAIPVLDACGEVRVIVEILRDVTTRKQAAEENAAVGDISQLFLMRNDLKDIYNELPLILSERFMFPMVTMELYDRVEGTLRLVASVGREHSAENEPFCVPVEQSFAGKVVLKGTPFYDTNADNLSEDQLGIFGGMGFRTIICVPITGKGKILGTLCLADTRQRRGVGAFVKTLQVIANHLAQELERLKAWDAVIKAKNEWMHTFDAVPDLICILDKKFRIVRINHAMAERLGMHPAECIGRICYQRVHHTDEPPHFCPHAALLKDGREHMAEVHEEHLGGDFMVTTSPIYDEKKQLIGSVHVAREITDRKRAEEEIKSSLKEKEILLREIHHRVKNNMQIISSLLKLSTEYVHDKSILNIFAESQDRIKSMALIHEKLYQSTDLAKIDFSEYVECLANELYRVHGVDAERIALRLSMGSVFLSIDNAIPCGLIVNELIMNSLKHAFPGDAAGEIAISLSEQGDDVIQLIISDNGIGIPPPIDLSKVRTLGIYIVNILVEDQLEGSITVDRTKGTTFRITFSRKTGEMEVKD